MFHTIFYEPIYNLLAVVLTFLPLHDIGGAIIVVTCIVKFILLPLNISALKSQYLMKRIEGEMKRMKEKYKDTPQEMSKHMMELYKKEGINPLSSLFSLIVQIPIVFALYFVFSKGMFNDPESLYSFVTFPETLHLMAFGLFDVTKRSIVIGILAGISSYMLAKRQADSMTISNKPPHEETFQDQFAKSMRIQMLYVLPVIVAFSGFIFPSALSLYWFISNMIGYAQDVYIKKKLAHLKPIK